MSFVGNLIFQIPIIPNFFMNDEWVILQILRKKVHKAKGHENQETFQGNLFRPSICDPMFEPLQLLMM